MSIPIPIPQPVIPTIKLRVLKNLRIGDVIYTEGHEIEVFHAEAVQLLNGYPDYFEVIAE